MKWSIYNHLFKSSKYGYFLYNSRTNSFLKLSEGLFRVLQDVSTNINKMSVLDSRRKEELIRSKVFVKKDEDENFILQKRMLYYYESYSKKRLNLVIAPTYNCNFECPYCYEHDLPAIRATEEIGDDIIKFIKSTCDSKEIAICWYGGEPLLNFGFIKKFLSKVSIDPSINLVDHSLVTNGYLLTEEKCNFFNKFKTDIQVTIDGPSETHNILRKHKSGVPTYDRILKNIDTFTELCPESHVFIRVNICHENKEKFPALYKELSKRWKNRNCDIYTEYVNDHGDCNVNCIATKDKFLFHKDLYINHNMKTIDFYPSFQYKGCSATKSNSYVVGPLGELYKCWVDLGKKDRIIGNVREDESRFNLELIAEYMLGTDMYSDPKCRKCFMAPICSGGCNLQRLEQKLNNIECDVCPFEPDDIDMMLEIFYEQQNKKPCVLPHS